MHPGCGHDDHYHNVGGHLPVQDLADTFSASTPSLILTEDPGWVATAEAPLRTAGVSVAEAWSGRGVVVFF